MSKRALCLLCGTDLKDCKPVIIDDLLKLMEEKISGISTETEFGEGYAAASYEWYNEIKQLIKRGE